MKFLEDDALKSLCQLGTIPDNIIVLDIREPDEYAREHIAGSTNIQLSQLAATNPNQFKGKTLLVHCRSGRRTQHAQEMLSKLVCNEMICVKGGIDQWKRCGFKTVKNKKAPLELMRQVQIIVGLFVLLGVTLSYTVSPYFIVLSAFFGAGLMFAGLTGKCGLAKCLMMLPYNKRFTFNEGKHHA